MCNFIKSSIGILLSIAVLYQILKIKSATEKNPFVQELSPEDKAKFFISPDANPLINPSEIGIKCRMYQNAIMDPSVTKLGDLFDLNIEQIHQKIRTLLIISILSFVFLIFSLICMLYTLKKQSVGLICLSCIMLVASIIFAVANFVLMYKLLVIFYYSDMNKFIEFLKCKNVYRDGLNDYLFVEDLHSHVGYFIAFSVIQILWNLSTSKSNDNGKKEENNGNAAVELSENF